MRDFNAEDGRRTMGKSKLGYRSRKRRQKKIMLITIIVLAVLAVGTVLLYLLQEEGKLPGGRPGESTSAEIPGDTTQAPEGSTGDVTGSTEEPTEEPTTEAVDPNMTIEDVWANDPRTPVEVKGVYLSAAAAARKDTLDAIINLLDTTEVNAVVIDIKDDIGNLTVDLGIDLARQIGATVECTFTRDQLQTILNTLKEHDAYLIARIAAFRDNILSQKKTDCSLWWKQAWGGEIYKDSQGYYWLEPDNETVQQYLLDISQACVDMGFDEIQYDYIRFPTSYIGRVEHYGGTGYYIDEAMTIYNTEAAQVRIDAVMSFVEKACRTLVPQGVFVSADVYGIVINSAEDAGNVGQDYAELSKWLDYICPMVYPSHYSSPIYGVQYPDTDPYTIVKGAMTDSKWKLEELEKSGKHCAIVRAWMQTFTANWLGEGKYLEYGGAELRQQINAVYDAGYKEWILWNSSGKYDKYVSGIEKK